MDRGTTTAIAQGSTGMTFEPILVYLEFFRLGSLTPATLRAVVALA